MHWQQTIKSVPTLQPTHSFKLQFQASYIHISKLPALAINTWQVDRKCWPISASPFDKMCADMKVSNTVCPSYALIMWQVDRKCHLISASSFDKLCADMKAQPDDMTPDLSPGGSCQIVIGALAANNQVTADIMSSS